MQVNSSLGEVYNPFGAHLQDPYAFYARARTEEPVFYYPPFNTWVVTRYDDIWRVLRDPQTFSSANAVRPLAPLLPASLAELEKGYPLAPQSFNSDGDAHHRLRAPLTRVLSAARVDALEGFIQQRADALIDAFAGDGRAEIMDAYAYRLPIEVIAQVFRLEPADMEVASRGSYGGNRLFFSGPVPAGQQAANARDMIAFQRLCGAYVRARRAEPRGDLVSEVVAALAPGDAPLTFEQEAEAAQNVMATFLAGHVTTSGLIGNGLRRLLGDRAQWELLCARPALVANAVEEIARFDGPGQGFLRVATRPATVGGVELPAGAELLLLVASANHDPALCEHPEEFDITRAPTRHLAFVAGPHTCAGAALARRELAVTLRTLTRRLPTLRLVDDQDITIQATMVIRGPTTLHLTW